MKQDNTKLAVKCNNGTFVGTETDELIIWKGIPYATQPVGKLRWQKALPAADDDGVYEATKPGHVPIGPANDSMGTAEFGEDCLVLNIYSNTKCADCKKPVMVWIHGGGFCAESQASPLYNLANISKQCPDILFVSIDYRLGFLGFMNFERVPGGENFKEAGNTDMAIRHAAAGGNTYMYFIKKPVTTPQLGAAHAAELPYLFDNPIPDPMGSGEIVSTEDCEFRHVVKEMWTNFARTGNPSTGKYAWKKFSGDDRQTLVFDDTIGMQKDIFCRREDLMMSWAERLGNGSSKRVC